MLKRRKLDKRQCVYLVVTIVSIIVSIICFINSLTVEADTIEGLLHKNTVWIRWACITMVPAIICGFNMYFRICENKGKEVFK